MAIQTIGFAGFAGAYVFHELALHPVSATLSATLGPWDVNARYKAWRDMPMILPDVGVLLELRNRDLIDEGLFRGAMAVAGANFGRVTGDGWPDEATELWAAALASRLKQPSPAEYAAMRVRDWITEEDYLSTMRFLGASPSGWLGVAPLSQHRVGPERILDAYLRGMLSDDVARQEIVAAGGDLDQLWRLQKTLWEYPSILEMITLSNRGIANEDQFREVLEFNRVKDPEAQRWYGELRKGIPSTTDLITMGIREGFRPELARVYDYYSEFPELTRPWWGKLGLDYPIGIRENVRGQEKDLTLADIFWASHWHVMPLGSAFAAYQRFRPDRMAKYQEENPNIRPFLLSDLQLHMRLADLPPGVRDWMVALSHPPPTRRDIHWAVQYAGKDRAWVQNAWMDLGASVENAVLQADIEEGRTVERETRWMVAVKNRARQQTIRMIEGLYEDGTIERPFAMRQLSDAGLPAELSTQLLDITDFRVERSLVRASIAATGRDFLSGELSIADAETQLRRIGVQDSRIRNYLAAWSVRRDRRRKQAETAKITGWVSAGLLDVPTARRRLETLGWTDPDETLLLAEAQGKLAKRQAAEAKSFERDTRTRARELERLARDADSQGRKLRADANRVAPRSVLLRWLNDKILAEDEFRQMMRERGYPDDVIEDYIRDSKVEKPVRVERTAIGATFPRPPGSAHPAQTVLKRWHKEGIISLDQYGEMLGELGYGPEDIERFREEASAEGNGTTAP